MKASGWVVGGQRVRGFGDGVEADDDEPVDAEAQRGPDRGVQPGPAVEIPALGRCRLRDVHGREEGRDRRRGADVFVVQPGGDVVEAGADVLGGQRAAFHEDHAFAGRRGGGDHGGGVDPCGLDVAVQLREVDHPWDGFGQRGRVEQRR